MARGPRSPRTNRFPRAPGAAAPGRAGARGRERLRPKFDAFYLARGARRQKRLPGLDYAQPWVMDGAAYLAQANAGAPPALGRRLAVIGGGSAAMDVARSARRAGHEVRVLSLEREAQMPAQREEVIEAKEEGVAFLEGAMLCAAAADGAGGLELDCVRGLGAGGCAPRAARGGAARVSSPRRSAWAGRRRSRSTGCYRGGPRRGRAPSRRCRPRASTPITFR